ncbi:MAG: BLUF domain-containing protein [Xanthobacteraceae bacterium]|nr:BLUF domain-containing protein [Xanthobacteraceae bacterium]
MMLIRLTYFSYNRLNDWYASKDRGVAEILATSVANNLRDCITGALICHDRWFVQELEGAEDKVSAAFERILRDQRHRDVSLVTMQAVSARRFPNFAMACLLPHEDNCDLFRHYGEDEIFDPRKMRADRLSDLIEAMADRGTTGGQAWMKKPAMNAA